MWLGGSFMELLKLEISQSPVAPPNLLTTLLNNILLIKNPIHLDIDRNSW